MKEEVERIKKLVGIDHNRWEQPCTCDKCKNMRKVPCIGTPKDIEGIIDAGYADRLKETTWMVGFRFAREKPIEMIQPTEKDGWCAFRQPDGLCELHDLGLKPTQCFIKNIGHDKNGNTRYEISLFNSIINVTRYFNLWRMKPGKYVMVTNECGALDVIKEKFDNINIVEYGSE